MAIFYERLMTRNRAKSTPRTPSSPTPDRVRSNVLEPQVLSSSTEYRLLLDRIIKAAETTSFPSKRTFNSDDMANALPCQDGPESPFVRLPNSVFGVRSENQMRHDMKIGAAGELFVRPHITQSTYVSLEPPS